MKKLKNLEIQQKGKEIDDMLDAIEEGKDPPEVKKVKKVKFH